MNDKKISIIVPVYNGEKSIQKCLESIKHQDYKNIEVIIVDDGSTDGTEDICRRFAVKEERFIYHKQENTGVSSARNKGIQQATGEYTTFVDGDDYIESNHLSILFLGMDSFDISMVGYTLVDDAKQITIEHKLKKDTVISKEEMLRSLVEEISVSSVPWNKLYKTDIIHKFNIKYNPELKFGEDLLFNVEYISKINQGIAHPSATYNYIQHH